MMIFSMTERKSYLRKDRRGKKFLEGMMHTHEIPKEECACPTSGTFLIEDDEDALMTWDSWIVTSWLARNSSEIAIEYSESC